MQLQNRTLSDSLYIKTLLKIKEKYFVGMFKHPKKHPRELKKCYDISVLP